MTTPDIQALRLAGHDVHDSFGKEPCTCSVCQYPIRWKPALNRWVHVMSNSRYCEPAAPNPETEGLATP